MSETIEVHDVVQVNDSHGRKGWIGAFVLVTEVKSWGIQGFVTVIQDRETQRSAYIRLKFSEVDRIGRAVMQPAPTSEE